MNWGVIGHEWAVRLLRGHIKHDSVRHAYLLVGPRSIGRRTMALRFSQALNCQDPQAPGEPCRACRACEQVERMQHPDLLVVQAEDQGTTLRVDQVRELQHDLALSPYQSAYKVAVLLRFEEANISAANALLKTLEEPSPRVVLILTAESEELLLPTIVSRCETLHLQPVPLEDLAEVLRARLDISADQAEFLAHVSNGRPGYALRLHHEPDSLEARQDWLDVHSEVLSANRVNRFAIADTLAKNRAAMIDALTIWLSFWRDVFLKASGAAVPITNVDRSAEIEHLAGQLGFKRASQAVIDIEQIMNLLNRNINSRLALEVLMLDLPAITQV